MNKKSLRVFEFRDSYVLYIFYRNEHYMSISQLALIANMVQWVMKGLRVRGELETEQRLQHIDLQIFWL